MGNQLMMIDQGNLIGCFIPIGYLTIRDYENVPVIRKKFFKRAQAKS